MKQYVLITGATSGFGAATARKFAANGYHLIITGRRKERLDELSRELSKNQLDVITLAFDVRDEASVNAAIQNIPSEALANLSILVNNAGLAVGRDSIEDGITDDWNRMIDTNVKGLLYVSKAIIPYLKKNQLGHIINIASIAGKEVYLGGNVYCASKHAVDALSKAMRMELVQDGIKVTNIAPGAAETEFSNVRFKGNDALAEKVYEGFTPLYAEDIANTIYFCATLPSHVTINDLTIMPTAQATSSLFHKS